MYQTTTALGQWSERQCTFGYKQRKRTGAISSHLEELYLRDDISCGYERCIVCTPQPTKLLRTSPHILVVDSELLSTFLEVLELPHITNYVLPSSVLKKVLQNCSSKQRNTIKSLYKDARRHCHFFDDIHCRSTAAIRAAGFSPTLAVALHYCRHLAGRHGVVLASTAEATRLNELSLDPGSLLLDDNLPPSSLQVLPIAQYLQQYYSTVPAVLDLHASISQAGDASLSEAVAAEGPPGGAGQRYPHYLPAPQLDEGLASGQLLQGVLHVNARDRHKGLVQVAGGAGMVRRVLLPSSRAVNRALHGDTVVVRLLPMPLPAAPGAGPQVEAAAAAADDDQDPDQEQDRELDAEVALLDADVEVEQEPDEAVGDDTAGLAEVGNAPLPAGQVVGVLARTGTDLVACLAPEDEAAAAAGDGTGHRKELVKCLPMDRRYPAVYIRTRGATRLAGQRFVVRVDGWGAGARHPDGHVVRVVGPMQDLTAETDAVLVQSGVTWQPFCQGALDELPPVEDPTLWHPPAEAMRGRRDLTGNEYYVCSIDPPGCTDVDDALHVRVLGGGRVEVGVHIADVSWFVRQGGMLDQEAAARCTTVYLVDRRLDMLPGLLSEQLCSLRESQLRLAVSVVWTLGPGLEQQCVWFGRTLLRSRRQLTYYQAQEVLEGGRGGLPGAEAEHLRGALVVLDRLSAKLRAARVAAGALELSSAELRFRVGDGGQPQEVEAKAKVPMMDVVAEMMIAANSAVAERVVRSFPAAALLRNHPPPRPEGLEEVSQLYADAGAPLDASTNAALAASLAAACRGAVDPAAATLLKSLTTRAMSEAQYFCTGGAAPGGTGTHHYGLALEYYTHFTSPIRRYADVVVHRQLLAALAFEQDPPASPAAPNPAGGLSQPKEVEAAAAVMNQRHRAAKRAQKACSELYLLLLLHTQPHVEAALVYAVTETGVAVFIPQYHIKAVVHLVDRQGRVLPPLQDDSEAEAPTDDPFLAASRPQLSLQKDGSTVTIWDDAGRALVQLAPWQRVWVRLSADGSRAHGPRLRVRLLHPSHPGVRQRAAAEATPNPQAAIPTRPSPVPSLKQPLPGSSPPAPLQPRRTYAPGPTTTTATLASPRVPLLATQEDIPGPLTALLQTLTLGPAPPSTAAPPSLTPSPQTTATPTSTPQSNPTAAPAATSSIFPWMSPTPLPTSTAPAPSAPKLTLTPLRTIGPGQPPPGFPQHAPPQSTSRPPAANPSPFPWLAHLPTAAPSTSLPQPAPQHSLHHQQQQQPQQPGAAVPASSSTSTSPESEAAGGKAGMVRVLEERVARLQAQLWKRTLHKGGRGRQHKEALLRRLQDLLVSLSDDDAAAAAAAAPTA